MHKWQLQLVDGVARRGCRTSLAGCTQAQVPRIYCVQMSRQKTREVCPPCRIIAKEAQLTLASAGFLGAILCTGMRGSSLKTHKAACRSNFHSDQLMATFWL
jgi:hypothetical protein